MEHDKIQARVTSAQGRNECLDVMRGIGIILMLMGHIGFGMKFDIIIHTFHMPLFFFISGYFFSPRKYKSVFAYISHNARTLLVPYVTFVLFYQPLHYIYTGEYSFKYFFLSLISSNHNRIDVAGAMWFLLCLFSAKVMFYLLNKIFHNRVSFFAAIIAVTLIGNYIRKICMLPLCLDSAMSCMLPMYVGYALRGSNSTDKLKMSKMQCMGLIAILMGLLIACSLFNEPVTIRRNHYGNMALYWIACFSGIGATMLCSYIISNSNHRIVERIKQALCYIGKNSIVYLVLNELVIHVVGVIMRFVGMDQQFITNRYLVHALMLILVSAILAVIALLFNKTKLRFFIGK